MNLFNEVILGSILCLGMCGSCGGSDDEDPVQLIDIRVKSIQVNDFQNTGNSADIKVSFSKPSDRSLVSAYRIFISKASKAPLDTDEANALLEAQYYEIDQSGSSTGIELPASLNDTDGDAIVEDVLYQAYILSKGIEVSDTVSNGSTEFQLAKTNLVTTLVERVNGGSGGMAIDTNGNIYMADFGQTLSGPAGTRVFKITSEGNVSTFATGLVGASGNDFDSKGNLFQSNIQGQSISKITPDGTVSTFVQGNPIVGTVGISIDDDDVLFVADCSGNNILEVDVDGNMSVFASSGLFACPNGITRDENDNLYVANFSNGNVLKITPSGTVSVLASLPGNNNGHLVYHEGFLYVIARTANQIYKVSLTGSAELFAGSGGRGDEGGAALDATFSLPNDLIFSLDGSKLYVNDVVPTQGNDIAPCHIRVIEIVE